MTIQDDGFRLGLIADPHYHAVDADFGFDGIAWRTHPRAAVRTLGDSLASTRVYNESFVALPAALEAVAAQGLRHVVIAGDLTDDGQCATMDAAVALLHAYEERHGLRFYLTPGNHDFFGMHGRGHTKRFHAAGGTVVAVGSGPEATVRSPAMACGGYGDALRKWRRFGLMPREDDLHWETPFGEDPDPEARTFAMTSPSGRTRHRQIDASYLVEPEEGLWILSLDANVFPPQEGFADQRDADAVLDSTDAGWNAMLTHKPFVLDWISDVCRRARAEGKALLCFSHYPMVDPLRATLAEERALFGDTSMARRTPLVETARRLADTGLRHHFSGHLHVEAVSREHGAAGAVLLNHALPSLVAYPGGWKSVRLSPETMAVTHHDLEPEGFDAFFEVYRQEDASAPILRAGSYREFLGEHMRGLAFSRYLEQEWPQDLAAELSTLTIRQLLPDSSARTLPDEMLALRFTDLLVDFYRLRNGHRAAATGLGPERLRSCEALATVLANGDLTLQPRFERPIRLFGEMLRKYLKGDETVHGVATAPPVKESIPA